MVTWKNKELQQQMLDELYAELYASLNEAHLPADCESRKLSWDEAANYCYEIKNNTDNEITKLIYSVADKLYTDFGNRWDKIIDAKNLKDII
jgi:predicted HAD superfamily Cof-like phosphohydrolase